MNRDGGAPVNSWQTKPSDRFVLKWIKVHLSARITPHLVRWGWLRPWMITLGAASLGVLAGLVLALGWASSAGCLAACAQVLDGVDGQFARLTGRQSRGGAFWDSVLDRYADGALVVGLVIYLLRLPLPCPPWVVIVLGYLALTGSNLISYSSARAETLGIQLGKPTLASKGTRTVAMILSAWGTPLWPPMPVAALLYLVTHTQSTVIFRLLRAFRVSDPIRQA
jgi:phosphatidylglycerophosphate synthase